MSDDRRGPESKADKWRSLPPRVPMDDLVAEQEVPPKPQVISHPLTFEIDEATRYPV